MFCSLALLATISALWSITGQHLFLDSLLMAGIGFFIFGPQLLVGLAAAEIVTKRAACTANGFAGCFAYVGAAATGYPLGKIIDLWGWPGFFVTLLVCSAAIVSAWTSACGSPAFSCGKPSCAARGKPATLSA